MDAAGCACGWLVYVYNLSSQVWRFSVQGLTVALSLPVEPTRAFKPTKVTLRLCCDWLVHAVRMPIKAMLYFYIKLIW